MNIVIIGSGNVASHLGSALKKAGFVITQVYSRTHPNALKLAKKLKAAAVSDLTLLNKKADLYILAVKDDVIAEISNFLKLKHGILVHTSGSIEMSVLEHSANAFGVFYPLQTFSKNKKVSFKTIPICLEANSPDTLMKLKKIAGSISGRVYEIESKQRKSLHLAAVFACNFSNYLYVIAQDLLQKQGMSFDLLKPLIAETASKIKTADPLAMQTGPARRKDVQVISEHLKLLSEQKEYQKLYALMSELIGERFK